MNLDDIQAMFFQECEECLAAAEEGLRALEEGSSESIDAVFRAVHSIKGGAGAFGLDPLVAFAHQFETVLDLVRSGQLAAAPELVQLLHRSRDTLDDHVASARDQASPPADGDILAQLATWATGDSSPAPAAVETDAAPNVAAGPLIVRFRPHRGAMLNGAEPLRYLRELQRLGAKRIELDDSALPPVDELDPGETYLEWTVEFGAEIQEDDVREIFEFIEEDCTVTVERTAGEVAEAPPLPVAEDEFASFFTAQPVFDLDAAPPAAPAAAAPATEAGTSRPTETAGTMKAASTGVIRVDIEKVDRLVDVVGELVIAQSMLAQRLTDADVGTDSLEHLAQLIRDLQDAAMSMRAQPVKAIFSRVPRIVRDLEVETGKKVILEVTGEATEVDKTVIERLGEPLTHLIRNAIDHGLETPEQRIAAGKPAEGTIRLAAEHRGGLISIRVIDDGRGVDHAKVKAKAIERGIIAADTVLSDDDALDLLFAPGFSTAAKISNISGRGVGLDVVRQNIQALGGRVSISTQLGEGTCFTLTLPLTLAVLDGMVVGCGEQTYVVPVDHVIDCLRPTPQQLKSLGEGATLVQVRGRYIPVVSLARAFNVEGATADPTQAVLLLVDNDRYGPVALQLDQIIDQRQVVIKSLDVNCGRIEGIAGATILGDGRVALILDIDSICRSSQLGSVGSAEEA